MDKETWVRISHSVYGLLQPGLSISIQLLPLCIYHLALYNMQRGLHTYAFNKYLLVPGCTRPCG